MDRKFQDFQLMSNKTKKVPNIPELRFPEFRNAPEWIIRELDEFITERNQFSEENVPLFSLTLENGITPKTERYERSFLLKADKDAYKLALPDDFAYNPMNLRFGAIARHKGTQKIALSKYYNIFYCDKTVDTKFCELYFQSHNMIMFYDNMAIGSLIEKRRVHFSDFLKFNIPFPSLPEQQKIADCLTSIDEQINAQTQKLEALKSHKQGLMQQLFPAEGQTVPKLRFPEFHDAPEWRLKTLKQISPSIFDGTHQTPKYTDEGIPFFSVENLVSGNKNKFISREDYLIATNKNKPEKGDILITRIGKIGYSTVVNWDYEFSIYVTLAVLKKSDKFDSYYLHSYL